MTSQCQCLCFREDWGGFRVSGGCKCWMQEMDGWFKSRAQTLFTHTHTFTHINARWFITDAHTLTAQAHKSLWPTLKIQTSQNFATVYSHVCSRSTLSKWSTDNAQCFVSVFHFQDDFGGVKSGSGAVTLHRGGHSFSAPPVNHQSRINQHLSHRQRWPKKQNPHTSIYSMDATTLIPQLALPCSGFSLV